MENTDNKELFTKHGLKNTKHRNLVYTVLKQSGCPLTMEDVYLRLKELDTSISFSTVYRNLDAFAAKGLVEKSTASEDGRSVFELNHSEHRHRLVCIGCKKMINIEGCPLVKYEKALEKQTQFDITAHRLEIFGYCPLCKDKEL